MNISLTGKAKTATLKIEETVVAESVALLQEKLDEVLQGDFKKLQLDLLDCKMISSAGIRKIMLFYDEFTEKKGKIEIVKCSQELYNLFTLIKLNEVISVERESGTH